MNLRHVLVYPRNGARVRRLIMVCVHRITNTNLLYMTDDSIITDSLVPALPEGKFPRSEFTTGKVDEKGVEAKLGRLFSPLT